MSDPKKPQPTRPEHGTFNPGRPTLPSNIPDRKSDRGPTVTPRVPTTSPTTRPKK